MMPFEAQAPGAGLGRRAEDREREPLRGTLARAVAARRQHVLQRHDVPGLLEAGGGKQRRQQLPGGGLLRRAHLLEPQARLDVAAEAEIVPASPFRPVPRERGGLALVGLEARKELVRGGEEIGGRAQARRRRVRRRLWAAAAMPRRAVPARTTCRRSGRRSDVGHVAPPLLRVCACRCQLYCARERRHTKVCRCRFHVNVMHAASSNSGRWSEACAGQWIAGRISAEQPATLVVRGSGCRATTTRFGVCSNRAAGDGVNSPFR